MALKRGLRGAVLDAAKKRGADATHVARVALFGTRPTVDTNAGDAAPSRAAVGVGLQSVWQGPRKIKGGAPVLKRDQSA